MEMHHTLSHTTWECKYHVVFISKYRKKGLYDQLRKHYCRGVYKIIIPHSTKSGDFGPVMQRSQKVHQTLDHRGMLQRVQAAPWAWQRPKH